MFYLEPKGKGKDLKPVESIIEFLDEYSGGSLVFSLLK